MIQLKCSGSGGCGDKVGLATVINGISTQRQTFLADGGVVLLVGKPRKTSSNSHIPPSKDGFGKGKKRQKAAGGKWAPWNAAALAAD